MAYIFLFLGLLTLSAALAGLSSAPWVPIRKRDIARFLDIADIKSGDVFYDLGCGDGRILRAAKKKGAKPIGLEISILNYWYCKIFVRNAKIIFKNFFHENFKDADIVYMFLSQKSHNIMGRILKKQMKSGTKIVCYVWPIEGWQPEKVNKKEEYPILYLYKI